MKKRIVFACAGEGKGHASSVVGLSDYLKDMYDIVYFCPDTVKDFILQHIPDADIRKVPFLGFRMKGHKVDYFGTVYDNSPKLFTSFRDVKSLAKMLLEMNVDTVISDFEPYISYAANIANIPLLNLNHPGVVIKHFSLRTEAITARALTKILMPAANQNLICSFYNGDVGPIIRKEITSLEPYDGGHIVVYMKEEEMKERLMKVFAEYPDQKFEIFPDKNKNFAKSLEGAKAVIGPSGHQLMTECLFLKKPMLVFPQKKQYEQILNAKMLKSSGWGMAGNGFFPERAVRKFMENLDKYPVHKPEKKIDWNFTDDTAAAAQRIIQFIEQHEKEEELRFDKYRYTYLSTMPEKFSFWKKRRQGR